MPPNQPSDSFLPSGAIDAARRSCAHEDASITMSMPIPPMAIPRSIPGFISTHGSSGADVPKNLSSSQQQQEQQQHQQHQQQNQQHHLHQHQQQQQHHHLHHLHHHPPMSPPKTRSASAEDTTAGLVENWRAYTQKLRAQHQGEKAHMLADRQRAEEVMDEERSLWEEERAILKARIAQMEARENTTQGHTPLGSPSPSLLPPHAAVAWSPRSQAVSVSSAGAVPPPVPQESGRDADGSPFYAPAPRNPSRTFDPARRAELRIDDIAAPRDSGICVTSKVMTPSDFGIHSPVSTHELETISETPAESIDISIIQPDLEGVAIKASAVSATFIAHVMSPHRSPPTLALAPDTPAPARDVTNQLRSPPARGERERKTLEVALQPENRRLTMYAGHTPNHSISKFPFLGGDAESGSATPVPEHREEREQPARVTADEETQPESAGDEGHGDEELTGPLGLTNDAVADDAFLAQLTEKLELEARKSAEASPHSLERSLSPALGRPEHEADKDEGPRLRLKPSINFGRPMGTL